MLASKNAQSRSRKKPWIFILIGMPSLIDEADVFLDRRTSNDLVRNQLVSSKSSRIPLSEHVLTAWFGILGVA